MGLEDITYGYENEELVRLLESIDRPGDYCVGGKLLLPMPRVTVDGVGELSFPVPEAQIEALINAAERAPYGKGTRTFVDTEVRDCWQVDADRISLGGRAWPATFKNVMDLVATGLGLAGSRLGAKPYKLLVYRKGGFFAAHRDTEKVPGMVATLSVTLPAQGTGGELLIRHGDEETVLDMCAQEPSELAFAAFYADCLHEAKPVTGGHRVSLVFNLFIRSGKKWTGAPDYSGLTAEVTAQLEKWRDQGRADKLVWLLDHAYSEDGLSFETLKNTDAAVASVLEQAADGAGCEAYAAVLHIDDMGEPEFDYGDGYGNGGRYAVPTSEMEYLIERAIYLDNWVARDGSHPPFGELPLVDGELHPPGALDDAQPDDECFEDYQGNYGPTLELFYRRAALVVWPREKAVDVMASTGIEAAVAWAAAQSDRVDGAEMGRILARLADLWPAKGHPHHNRPEMLRLLAANGNAGLGADFLGRIVLDHYDGSENAPLAGLLPVVGPGAAGPFLAQLLQKHLTERPKEVVSLLTLAHEEPGKEEPEWRGVERDAVRACLSSLRTVLESGSDAVARAEAYRTSGRQTGYISQAEVEQRNMDSAAVRDLFVLAWRLGLAEEASQAARSVARFPQAITPDRTLPAALADMYKHEGLACTEAYRLLWQQAADCLLSRSSAPPEDPADWTIDAHFPDTDELSSRLRAFCKSPAARVLRVKVASDGRKHLRRIIDSHQLDMDHETEHVGRPYTLVCTKNRAGHKRRLREYAEDVRCIGLLTELAPGGDAATLEADRMQRLQRAEAAGKPE